MALRPLAFGARFRDGGRTVQVRARSAGAQQPKRWVVEVGRRGGKTRAREHGSLAGALREFASAWRSRLH